MPQEPISFKKKKKLKSTNLSPNLSLKEQRPKMTKTASIDPDHDFFFFADSINSSYRFGHCEAAASSCPKFDRNRVTQFGLQASSVQRYGMTRLGGNFV